jgi:polyphosphate kinase
MTNAIPLLDRDHSILTFNERVLDWAKRADVPLLERLRFLCIVSSNLDEFFEVRAEPHLTAAKTAENKGWYSVASFESLAVHAHAIVKTQYELFNDHIMPALAQQGIHMLSHGERSHLQKRWVKHYFDTQVRPLLTPVGLDPAHPFPQVANKSLNFIVRLGGKDAFGRSNDVAIVKVPRALPRLIRMPSKIAGRGGGKGVTLVSLSSVIRAHLADLFVDRDMSEFSQFRVTRHSDLEVDEAEVTDLRTALRLGLQHRNFGEAVRLEVSSGCSEYLSDFLLKQFALPAQALYRVHGPVNLVRFTQLIDLVNAPQLLFPTYKPSWPQDLRRDQSIFSQLRARDVLIHQPYESFEGVLAFLREAVRDPAVLSIRQTLYRTGADSEMMDLLLEAVKNGKEVTVVVELKARFDEEVNIHSAEALAFVGAQVVYGVVGLKTHAKMLLVTRKEGKGLQRYVHLSTGNYNPRTAKLYTDFSYLTANPAITSDVEAVFANLASQTRLPKLKKLWVAPFDFHSKLINRIEHLSEQAASGKVVRIVAKMNALTDEALTHALMKAGKRGAQIDLIVRGACILPVEVPGNIRVRSIVGRLLEHSRVFYFRCAEAEELYLSSADWMNRNMLRRVEIAWPITAPDLRQRIVDECLVPYLFDTQDAWLLGEEGYARSTAMPKRGAQEALMQRYQRGGL